MSLNLRVGQGCERMMDDKLRGLNCQTIQIDEAWGFIGKKQRNVTLGGFAGDGKVEVFGLIGHPNAIFCYAWGFESDSGEMKAVTVLALPPIDTALKAVQAFIASTVKGNHAET